MHSFHQSRGRILFEVFCALTVGASCYGAWTQTGAWALLPAAAVAALYGLVHLFDLRRAKPVAAVERQRIAFDDDTPSVHLAAAVSEPVTEVADELEAVELALGPEPAKPKTTRASKPRRTKTMRKGGRRADDEPVAPVAPAAREEAEAASPTPFDETVHSNIEPLFEPEPFVRMPRPAFGRKAG
jgi:hypothetical protein